MAQMYRLERTTVGCVENMGQSPPHSIHFFPQSIQTSQFPGLPRREKNQEPRTALCGSRLWEVRATVPRVGEGAVESFDC